MFTAASEIARAQVANPNSGVYSGGSCANSIASGNALVATSTNTDWNTVANTISPILNDWVANHMDSLLMPYFGQVDPAKVNSGSLNLSAILQQIRQFQPSTTLAQVQDAVSYLDSQSLAQTQQVISTLAQSGLTPFLESAANQAVQFGQGAFAVPPKGGPGHPVQPLPSPTSAIYDRSARPTLRRVTSRCAQSNAGAFAVGTAFAVIAIMAGPADVLALAAWGAISLWGGSGAAAWGIGNAIACGF